MYKRFIGWFVCASLLTGCTSNIETKKQTFTIELGHDVFENPSLYVKNASDYQLSRMEIKAVSNGIRKKENRFVTGNMDYLVVGEYDFQVIEGHRKVPFKIKIKDTKAPVFEKLPEEVTIGNGKKLNWDTILGASDLSGVEYNSDPEIDTSVSGTYDTTVEVKDRFGNSTSHSLRVIVE